MTFRCPPVDEEAAFSSTTMCYSFWQFGGTSVSGPLSAIHYGSWGGHNACATQGALTVMSGSRSLLIHFRWDHILKGSPDERSIGMHITATREDRISLIIGGRAVHSASSQAQTVDEKGTGCRPRFFCTFDHQHSMIGPCRTLIR